MAKTYEVSVDDTSMPGGIAGLIRQLPDIQALAGGDRIEIKVLPGEFVYLTGLVLLAAWRKALPIGVIVHLNDEACNPSVRQFLTNTGFREIVDTGREEPSVFPLRGRVPLQPITNTFAAEQTVSAITNLFDDHAPHVPDKNPFRTLLSELCENVLAHSELVHPGYICARVLNNDRAEIAIADTGIGILKSYLSGTNVAAIERIKAGASPLSIAVEGLASSKPIAKQGSSRSYYGFGLFITRRLVEENRGRMMIVSGDQYIQIDRFARTVVKLERPWPGTFVAIVLDMNNPLPLEEIYEQAAAKVVPGDTARSRTLAGESVTAPATAAGAEQKSVRKPEGAIEVSRGASIASASRDAAASEAIQIALARYGTSLLTREVGTAIRADIASELVAGVRIEVSLKNLEDVTPSVIDEAFGKLVEKLGLREFENRISFVDGAPLVSRLIEFVLRTRAQGQSGR